MATASVNAGTVGIRNPEQDPTLFQVASHVALLLAAFFVLQFPQFLSGREASALMALLYVISLLSWPRVRPLFGPLGSLVLLAAISAIWSEAPASALNGAFQLGVTVAAGVAVGCALPIKTILSATSRVAAIIGILSLVLYVVAPSIAIHSGPAYSGTLQGIYISKNALAIVIVFGAAGSLFRSWNRGRERTELIASWAVYVGVLYLADSATAVLILCGAIVIRIIHGRWLEAAPGTRAAATALIIAPGLLVALSALSIYNGVLDLLGRDSTLTGRTAIWEAAIIAWQSKPWLGVGWGTFAKDSAVSDAQVGLYGWVRDHAHSGYVQVLTELGLVGVGLIAILLLVVLSRIATAIRRTQTLAAGWPLAILFVFATHNIAEQSMRLLPMFMLAVATAAAGRLVRAAPAARSA